MFIWFLFGFIVNILFLERKGDVVFSLTSYRACVHAQPINRSSYNTAIPSPSRIMLQHPSGGVTVFEDFKYA